MWKSGNVTEQTQSSFAYDKCNIKQAGTAQYFVVGHKVMPADVQHVLLTPHVKGVCFPIGLYNIPCFKVVAQYS